MPEKKVTSLFNRLQRNEISTKEFCEVYERIWNFEFDKRILSDEEFKALDYLFDEVALHCPLPREKWEYPRYRDDLEIRTATEKVRSLLTREL